MCVCARVQPSGSLQGITSQAATEGGEGRVFFFFFPQGVHDSLAGGSPSVAHTLSNEPQEVNKYSGPLLPPVMLRHTLKAFLATKSMAHVGGF